MRYLSFTFVFLLAGCVTFGIKEEGNGDMISETYDVEEFSRINIGGAYSVVLVPSNREKVEVEIDNNLVEYLVVEVEGNTLKIYNSERIYSDEGIEIVIFFRELEEIMVSGACELQNEEIIKAEDLMISMSGAGAIDLNLEVNELKMQVSGAGAVKLKGKADYQRVEMSGAGGYSGFGLESRRARIEISGVGSADVTVYEELDAAISGLGGIKYKGDPENVQSDIGGLGTVNKAD